MGRYTLNPHILLASTSGKFARSRKRARDSARTKSESITKSAAGLDMIVMGTVFTPKQVRRADEKRRQPVCRLKEDLSSALWVPRRVTDSE